MMTNTKQPTKAAEHLAEVVVPHPYITVSTTDSEAERERITHMATINREADLRNAVRSLDDAGLRTAVEKLEIAVTFDPTLKMDIGQLRLDLKQFHTLCTEALAALNDEQQ